MNIKLLAVAVAAAVSGSQALAAQIYSDDSTTLSIGGHVSVGVGEYGSDDDVDVHQVSPRINVAGTQDLGNGFVVDAKGEWALNYLDGADESFTTRLGYIGVTHDSFGRLAVGTQWAPYYDIAGVADQPIAFANDFIYKNHGTLGSGRADKMVSYRNSFNVTDTVGINLGLGWQGDDSSSTPMADTDARVQAALSVDFMDFTFGYVYSGGEIGIGDPIVKRDDAISHVLSAKYGSYGDGIYVAAVYGMNEYFYTDKKDGDGNTEGVDQNYEETVQMEALLAYGMPNGLNLMVNYEAVENDKTSKTLFSQMALQAEYTVMPKLVTYAGYQIDLGDDDDTTEDDDKWSIGVRYFL